MAADAVEVLMWMVGLAVVVLMVLVTGSHLVCLVSVSKMYLFEIHRD